MARKKSKLKNGHRLIASILTLVLIAAAVLGFVYRDRLFPDRTAGVEEAGDPYAYEYGSNQQFALVGSSLAVSSSTGLQLLDRDGYPLLRQVFSMKNPALSAGNKNCVFYDIGGTALRLYANGEILELDTAGKIISVSMSSSGYFAVSCEETGYKGAVTVYNSGGKEMYKWSSGTGYVLDAALSPDGSRLAVLCLESSGSVIHFFGTKDDNEIGTANLPRELAFKLSFSGGSFCALSESSLRFFSPSGEETAVFDLGDMSLLDYLITEELCVLSLSKYITGNTVTLTSFGSDGKTLGTAELGYSPLALSAGGGKLLVLDSGAATLFSRELSVLSETSIPAGYGKAVYLPDGSCLLLSSYRGEKISVR